MEDGLFCTGIFSAINGFDSFQDQGQGFGVPGIGNFSAFFYKIGGRQETALTYGSPERLPILVEPIQALSKSIPMVPKL